MSTSSSRFQGRVVAVTGAAGGLGRATALALAAEGASLVLTDRDAAGLEDTAAQVRATGREALTQVGDVGTRETHEAWVDAARKRFGALHGLCNVAGVLGPGPLESLTAERFEQVMRVNCLGPLLAIQAAVPLLRASGGTDMSGAIVNVSSIGGLVALPMMTAYCASKSALIGLTRAVAAELAPHVRCNAVCPGGIDTPMARSLIDSVPADHRAELMSKLTGRQLLPRFAQPEEIARVLVFLISDDAAFMTGAIVAADGGHSAA